MNRHELMNSTERLGLAAALIILACALYGRQGFAQTSSAATQKPTGAKVKNPAPAENDTSNDSAATQKPTDAKVNNPAPAESDTSNDHELFRDIYQEFYDTYRLGPADEVAIRVTGQPDYTVERAKVSPTGSVYHPLLGDLDVAGLTVTQLKNRLTKDLSEFLINPRVSVTLIEANSAKIGVLGDVVHPGIVVMNRPMNILEAIVASGGFANTGSKSGVTVLRQTRDGRAQTFKVNVKRILEGKAQAEENIALRGGDTVIVHGNARKKLDSVLSLAGFGSFLSFISMGRR